MLRSVVASSIGPRSVALLAAALVTACTGAKRTVELRAVDGSRVAATAYLEEVIGKSGKVITARMDVTDPAGRALTGLLVEGRCAQLGRVVDSIPISSATGHFRGSSPTKIARLVGTHAIGLFLEAGVTEDRAGAPVACADL